MPVLRRESLRWLNEAMWDLDTARILHEAKRFNAAVFYAHQAAEKASKAMLYHVNEAPWGHSVRELLLRYFEKIGKNPPEDMMRCARELDRHYIPSRYPNAHPSATPHEAYDEEVSLRAIRCADMVVGYAKEVIGQ
ncbi:MAG: HEPN domain-containing protein [Candidatus Bathyarchaeota archaeon]|nr:HEPN domain-containing protein [Candidatus Bathyarchaeota archaeon]